MAANDILPFAQSAAAADVMNQTDYAASTERTEGHAKGKANRQLENKALRQSSAIAAGVAAYVAANQATDVTDSLGASAFAAILETAIQAPFADPVKSAGLIAAIPYIMPEAFGAGAQTQASIDAALVSIGTTDDTTLMLSPGIWTISSTVDWSAYTNVTFDIRPGAVLQIATGVTVTLPRMNETGTHQRFDCVGTGAVDFAAGAVSFIDPNWWGENKSPKTTDMTAQVQAAMIAGISSSTPLIIPSMMLLTSSVNIDRQVDNIAYNEYFDIVSYNGGGFYVSSAIPMFSSSLAFTTAPVSQLIRFNGIHFNSSDTNLNAYVLDDSRFLRTSFHGCTFEYIKCLVATIYTQSIYFEHCNIRRWTGWFFYSPVWTFDLKVSGGNLIETGYGSGFAYIKAPQATVISGNVIEGIASGTAIWFFTSKSILIAGNYFEGNSKDIEMSSTDINYGVSIFGNNIQTINWAKNFTDDGCASIGNVGGTTGTMHNFTPSNVLIKDSTLGAIITDRAIQNSALVSPSSPAYREDISATNGQYAASATSQSSFDVENKSAYRVVLTVFNGADAVDSVGEWVVTRQGTGTKVTPVLTPNYFTCTMSTYKIVITNTDTSTRYARVVVSRMA